MRREPGQLPTQPVTNLREYDVGFQQQQPLLPIPQAQTTYQPPLLSQPSTQHDDKFNQLHQIILTQQQSLAKLESQLGQIAETTMRRELSPQPSQPITNLKFQPLGLLPQTSILSQPSPPPLKGLQFENTKTMSALRSDRVLEDSYESQNIVDSSSSWAQEETIEEEDEELLEEDE